MEEQVILKIGAGKWAALGEEIRKEFELLRVEVEDHLILMRDPEYADLYQKKRKLTKELDKRKHKLRHG
ncbi:MAG: hypothetical protein NXI20_28230 [bacterium]|nr:hypothetical protein [bacterium]